jgi:hypothetical protein
MRFMTLLLSNQLYASHESVGWEKNHKCHLSFEAPHLPDIQIPECHRRYRQEVRMSFRSVLLVLFCSAEVLLAQGGLPDIFNDQTKPGRKEPAQPPPAPGSEEGQANDDFEERLKSLKALRASKTPEVFTLREAREKAAEFRRRVNAMKTSIYIPWVQADAGLGNKLKLFEERWGDLIDPIFDGQVPSAPINAERWTRYARTFSNVYCGNVPLIAPPKGLRPVGEAWSCLSDRFFHEFSELTSGARAALTNELEAAMGAAESKLALSKGLDEGYDFYLKDVAKLLFNVDQIGMDLRIRELEARHADSQSAVMPFPKWIERNPAAHGAAKESKVKVTLGKTQAEVAMKTPNLPQAARDLRRVHDRLATLQPNSKDWLEEQRSRARILMTMATQAR